MIIINSMHCHSSLVRVRISGISLWLYPGIVVESRYPWIWNEIHVVAVVLTTAHRLHSLLEVHTNIT